MSADSAPKMPAAQLIYGGIVYWVTILAAIVCMVGPLVAMADVDGNVLNPHYVFSSIFSGEDPASVWALSANDEVRLDVATEDPDAGVVVHPARSAREAVAILEGLAAPSGGEARATFSIEGEPLLVRRPAGSEGEYCRPGAEEPKDFDDARAIVLARYSVEVFGDGHFWLESFTAGDGFTQFGLALGCSVALWALIAVAGAYLKDRLYLFVFLSLWVAALVFLSAAGIIEGGH